eukprot:CAMPEP_0184329648 /NCGR_PEP_ID=MMETSP1049-20130417/144262_1 /TAXON_ID=77928 /ORGANISM="Proteomonas sulcata, Strain CCMP704" /LENGTH=291 /DNA_ID=CAMNT_0026652031 /DNA_START=1106 /DNA_END=1981 /DNA_ORIENTATION=+
MAVAVGEASISQPAMRLRGGGPVSFSKLSSAPAVLKDGYGTDAKLEINTSTDINGGTGLTATFVRAAADTIQSALKGTTSVQGVDVEASIDQTGTISAEGSYSGFVDGLKLTANAALEGGQSAKDIAAPTVSAEYTMGDLCATASVAGKNLAAGAVVDAGDVTVGASTTYDSSAGTLGDPSFAAKYDGGKFALSGLVKGLKGDDLTATYTQSVNSDLSVAGSFNTNGNSFEVGADYKIDADSGIKGKLNSDGILNVGYSRKTTAGSKLNAGLQVDTHDLDKRKMGVSCVLG